MTNCEVCDKWLLDEIDGSLQPTQSKAFQEHLKTKKDCSRAFEEARETLFYTRHHLPLYEPPPSLDQSIIAFAQKAIDQKTSKEQISSKKAKQETTEWWEKVEQFFVHPFAKPALGMSVAILVMGIFFFKNGPLDINPSKDVYAPANPKKRTEFTKIERKTKQKISIAAQQPKPSVDAPVSDTGQKKLIKWRSSSRNKPHPPKKRFVLLKKDIKKAKKSVRTSRRNRRSGHKPIAKHRRGRKKAKRQRIRRRTRRRARTRRRRTRRAKRQPNKYVAPKQRALQPTLGLGAGDFSRKQRETLGGMKPPPQNRTKISPQKVPMDSLGDNFGGKSPKIQRPAMKPSIAPGFSAPQKISSARRKQRVSLRSDNWQRGHRMLVQKQLQRAVIYFSSYIRSLPLNQRFQACRRVASAFKRFRTKQYIPKLLKHLVRKDPARASIYRKALR